MLEFTASNTARAIPGNIGFVYLLHEPQAKYVRNPQSALTEQLEQPAA
jgi:hypothetical protein